MFNKLRLCLVAAAVSVLAACGDKGAESAGTDASPQKTYKWKLVTSWPKNFPGLGKGPETFAKYVNEMSNGRLQVKVYGSGELVPGFEVFDAVSQGTAEMGHSAGYYWKGKVPAAQFFTGIPFGMNVTEMNGWVHYGGGLELWRELYAPFNLIPFAGGNTGVQMAGWFKKEIKSVEDLKGLKMRIPGLGGEVLERMGGLPVTMTGAELFTALQTGAIDATEWAGPYNDMAFGLYKAADYYYYTGWHEPSAMLEFLVNKEAYEALPSDLQKIIEVATRAVNQDVHDEYTARNNESMKALIEKHNVKALPLPESVVAALKQTSENVIREASEQDPQMKKVYDSYMKFMEQVSNYHRISEHEYYNNRSKY